MVNLKIQIREGSCGDLGIIIYPEHSNPTDKELMQSAMLKYKIEKSIEFINTPIRDEFKEFVINRMRDDDMSQIIEKIIDSTVDGLREMKCKILDREESY